jgi:hypothetical protein
VVLQMTTTEKLKAMQSTLTGELSEITRTLSSAESFVDEAGQMV